MALLLIADEEGILVLLPLILLGFALEDSHLLRAAVLGGIVGFSPGERVVVVCRDAVGGQNRRLSTVLIVVVGFEAGSSRTCPLPVHQVAVLGGVIG